MTCGNARGGGGGNCGGICRTMCDTRWEHTGHSLDMISLENWNLDAIA